MDQKEAITVVSLSLMKDPAVRAVFLKGSQARGEQDIYSDVDMYCLVYDDALEGFLGRRIPFLEEYKKLIYWSESNFVGPQIVGVYEDGLHFDLYTVTVESLKRTDEILILHDPEGLLVEYKAEAFSISDAEVTKIMSGFTFSLLEFESAFHRGDVLWAHRLGSHLATDLMMVLRHMEEPDKAGLGIKGVHRIIKPQDLNVLTEALNAMGPDNLPNGVKMLLELATAVIERFSDRLDESWNQSFFDFMVKRIRSLTPHSNHSK
jgi:predicted nucleotidyltransferase